MSTIDSQAEITEQLCGRCGSEDIREGMGVTGANGGVKLTKGGGMGSFKAIPIAADVCKSCGTIVRFFVRESSRDELQS